MKLALIAILAASFAWLLMYGALRTAEKIAKNQMEFYEKH